jgi:hypothetical protein
MQFLFEISAITAFSFLPGQSLPVAVRIGLIAGAPLLLLGVNIANFTIHNASRSVFRHGCASAESGTNGIETMGRRCSSSSLPSSLLASCWSSRPSLAGATCTG